MEEEIPNSSTLPKDALKTRNQNKRRLEIQPTLVTLSTPAPTPISAGINPLPIPLNVLATLPIKECKKVLFSDGTRPSHMLWSYPPLQPPPLFLLTPLMRPTSSLTMVPCHRPSGSLCPCTPESDPPSALSGAPRTGGRRRCRTSRSPGRS